MRGKVILLLLLVGLIVDGCGGAGGATMAPAHVTQHETIVKLNATSGSSDAGIGSLLKADPRKVSVPPTVTPTPETSQKGPLSCIDQRLQQLRQGDVLPTDGCRS
ncbi:MAG TPA: hypothetical protein VKX96_15460 [Chloroflexota bacterium]|nr:hypothetical protein [Chloroflexota bacterium]